MTVESLAELLCTAKYSGIADPARLFREVSDAERTAYLAQAIRLLTDRRAA